MRSKKLTPNQNDIRSWLEESPSVLLQADDITSLPMPNQLCTDSRLIKKNSWFVPLKGEHHDAHNFIEQVVDAGAEGVFYDPKIFELTEKLSSTTTKFIPVQDTYKTWVRYARGLRRANKNIKITAVSYTHLTLPTTPYV